MGLSSDDQKPPFSNEVDNLTFGEKEINYDNIKDIHNEPEQSHSASEYLVIYIIRIYKMYKCTYMIMLYQEMRIIHL